MVKGTINISLEYILERVDPYQAYLMYCPVKFVPNKAFCNPLRKDRDPSFIIGNKNGQFGHFDFVDERFRGSFVDFVMQRFNIDMKDALKKIANDFQLNKFDVKVQERKIEPVQYKETLIQVKTKPFDSQGLAYWNEYSLSIDDLKKENIYYIDQLYINRKKVNFSPTELVFGYMWEDGKYWKIYRPLAKIKANKWKNNCPIDLVDGLDNIKNCNKAILTKSKKDKAVIYKVFNCIAGIQNESKSAINAFTKEHLEREAKEVYLNFDSDLPGKTNSKLITAEFGWKHINVPDEYLSEGIKDFADLVKKYGLDKLVEIFKEKELL